MNDRRLTSVLLFMAERAVDAGLLLAMAVHAAAHRQIGLTSKRAACRNRPVALLAGVAGRDVFAVVEEDEAGHLINADPLDFMVVLARVTLPANGGLGQSHHLARIGVDMT